MQCLIPIYIYSIIIGDGCVISSLIKCGVQCECFVPSVDPITHRADVIIHCASVGVLCIYQLHGKWVVHVKLSRSNEVVLKAMALCYCSNNDMSSNRICHHCHHRTGPDSRGYGATWGLPGADRTQVGLMWAAWTLLSGSTRHRCALVFLLIYTRAKLS